MAKPLPTIWSVAGVPQRRAAITVRLSDLGVPIAHDGLVIGRDAPVALTAVARALEALSPGVYEMVALSHDEVSAVALRKELTRAIPREALVELLVDAFLQTGLVRSIARARVHVSVQVTHEVEGP